MKNIDYTKWLIGGGMIFLGIGFLLERFVDGFDFGRLVSISWPVLLIFFGILTIIKSPRNPFLGIIFSLVGVGAIINEFTDFNVWQLWPIILIIIGISILFGKNGSGYNNATISVEDRIEDSAIFWGIEKRYTSQNFKGGSVDAVCGGAEIDLRDAKIAEEGAHLEVSAVFGGIDVMVPSTMKVKVNGNGIFGAFESKVEYDENKSGGTLSITGNAIFGAVEIKQK